MRQRVEINSGAFEKPFVTDAMVQDSSDSLVIKWSQLHEGDKVKSMYDINMDKKTGIAVITRRGEISSRLVFDTAHKSNGQVGTPYGTFDVEIKTDYINMPTALSPVFEICYDMAQGGETQIKNNFSVKFLLQR